MTEVVVSVENSVDIGNVVAAMRQLRGVAEVKVLQEVKFEGIPQLPYTYKKCMDDLRRAEDDYFMGRTTSAEELKKRIAAW